MCIYFSPQAIFLKNLTTGHGGDAPERAGRREPPGQLRRPAAPARRQGREREGTAAVEKYYRSRILHSDDLQPNDRKL